MATDFEQFKQKHDDAMKNVEEELRSMLPSDLEHLVKLLRECRFDKHNYLLLTKGE